MKIMQKGRSYLCKISFLAVLVIFFGINKQVQAQCDLARKYNPVVSVCYTADGELQGTYVECESGTQECTPTVCSFS